MRVGRDSKLGDTHSVHLLFPTTNIKNIHISDLNAWFAITFSPNIYEVSDNAVKNPLYYAENLYLNGELLSDITLPRNSIGYSLFGYKNLKNITIPKGMYINSLSGIDGLNITIEEQQAPGMYFDDYDLLWYCSNVNYGSQNGGLCSGNTSDAETIYISGRAYQPILRYSFLNNKKIKYVYLGTSCHLDFSVFYGCDNLKALFLNSKNDPYSASINHTSFHQNSFLGIPEGCKIVIKDDYYDFWVDYMATNAIENVEDRMITLTEWEYYQELNNN